MRQERGLHAVIESPTKVYHITHTQRWKKMAKSKSTYDKFEFGRRLEEERLRKNQQPEDVAYGLSMDKKEYLRYERGKSIMSMERLEIICKEFDFDLNYIISGKRVIVADGILEQKVLDGIREKALSVAEAANDLSNYLR